MVALLLVAVSVGLDNFGAASALGIAGVGSRLRIRIAIVFGVFEAGMPVIGILLGDTVARGLGSHAKLLAGAVLCAAGAYSVWESLTAEDGGDGFGEEPGMRRLLVLGVALSLDNLAIGFALGTRHLNVAVAALTIGLVSVALTLAGLELGNRLGPRLGRWGEVAGGALLIGVGVAVGTGLF